MIKKSKNLRLSDYCSDIFQTVIKMRLANDFGDGAAFRDQMKKMIGQMETNAQKGGFSSEQTDDARFALIAFIDEFIITSDWEGREDWIANPMQMELYHRFDAGEEFFNKLEEFQIQPQKNKEVIEVYFISMGLGFKGKYALDSKEKLESVTNKVYSGLKPFLGDTSNVLSPSAISGGAGRGAARKKLSFWYFGLGAAILGIIFYFVITLISINVVESAVEMLSK